MFSERQILGLDCDGVVADMNGYILPKINAELGTDFCLEDWNDWKVSACLGDEAEEIFKRHLGDPVIWTTVSLFPDIRDILSRLSKRFDLYMVSAVWYQFANLRKKWVHDLGLPFSEVICSSDKAGVAVNYRMIGFIEDRQDHARSVRDAGIKSYLIARPYNVDEPGIFRGSWAEVIQHIEQQAPSLESSR